METAPGSATPLSGRLLDDRYRLDREIARGGMATVYLATDTRLDRQVAVKVMHRALADDPEFVARFGREARAAARVQAPEVVQVHDQGTDRDTGLAYLVMEHVQGITLRQLLVERGPLTPSRATSVMEPVVRALAAAHAAGLVHRDVKPENVLLADDGRVKVADFGLARAIETSNLTQTTGLLIGTVSYLAPEQVETGSADARSDVYAAGIVLWELLTGAPPYAGESPLSVAYRHVHEDVPAPSSVVGGIPPALDELVLRATRRDPAARQADGAQLLAELQAVRAGLPPVDTATPVTEHKTLVVPRRPAAVTAPKRRRGGRRAVVLLLVASLLALAGGYYVGSYRYTEAPSVLTLTLAAATDKLEEQGLEIRHGEDRYSEDVPKGRVLHQDPDPSGRVRKGGVVTVHLSLGPDRRVVPKVVGQDPAAARRALAAVGLRAATATRSSYSASVPEGKVMATDPGAGTRLKPGTAVTLTISKGPEPVAVPDLTGKTQAEATRALDRLGLKAKVEMVFSDTVAKGRVVSQQPSSGTAAKGSTVTLQVSRGPDLVRVPSVIGMKPEDAERVLTEAGFEAQRVDAFFGRGKEVYNTDPSPGTMARRGSTVRYFVN